MGAHSFADLMPHVRHKIRCVFYGGTCKKNARNISVECVTCNEVLTSFDRGEKAPSNPASANTFKWADPCYKDLRCKCGNALEFREVALRETIQPFVMKGGETDFEDYDTIQEAVYPTSIECAECGEEVWSAKSSGIRQKHEQVDYNIVLDGGDWIKVAISGKAGMVTSSLREPGDAMSQVMNPSYHWAVGGIEATVLGHACDGIDICDPAYIRGIQSAVNGLSSLI